MVYRGHIENGAIQLEDAPSLPEGAEVEVRLLEEDSSGESEVNMPSILDGLQDFIGKAEGLPPDASLNVDHYLYGMPKRQ